MIKDGRSVSESARGGLDWAAADGLEMNHSTAVKWLEKRLMGETEEAGAWGGSGGCVGRARKI